MNARLAVVTLFLTSVALSAQPAPIHVPEAARQRVFESYGKLPLSFERNQGQAPADAAFVARGGGYTLALLGSGDAVLGLRREAKDRAAVLRMKLLGAGAPAVAEGRDEQPGRSNYFIGSDPAGWRTNIPNYAQVAYREVYPGVDLVYYGNQRRLEYDFVVAPGADPGLIRLELNGARRLRVDRSGDLLVGLAKNTEEIRFRKPVLYQEVEGFRKNVDGRYVVRGREIKFAVGSYDKARRLVIDPVLVYSTYLGGSDGDFGRAITVDSLGNAYVTGETSGSFPTTAGAYRTTSGGAVDAFVTKLNAAGSALLYSTYLGGSSSEHPSGIAVDSSANAYVTGYTPSPNFPTTAGAYQAAFGGGIVNAFVTKLNATGSALVYSTYLGGVEFDQANGIAVDSSGSAYVAGTTSSGNFPITAGAYQTGIAAGNDAFVTKLNAAGSALVYSTYLGGIDGDVGYGIAVDLLGNAYVVGQTGGNNFPTTAGAYQPVSLGGPAAFVTKLNAVGSALVYSTYLHGSFGEQGRGIAVDSSGNAYVTGDTNSGDFPTTAGAYQTTHGGGTYDAFVTKLNAAGSALVYSTYLGGAGSDVPLGIAVDSSGNTYVIGRTTGSFPTAGSPPQPVFGGGGFDAFVTKLNSAGSALLYSTYLGGAGADIGNGIAVDSSGNAYATGVTNGSFPTTAGAYQTTYGGNGDAFIAKIDAGGSPSGDITYIGTNLVTISCPAGVFTVPGNITIINNLLATNIDCHLVTSVSGNISVSGDTGAITIDLGSLQSVGGDISVSGDTGATTIDLGSLQSVGGDISVSGDTGRQPLTSARCRAPAAISALAATWERQPLTSVPCRASAATSTSPTTAHAPT